MTSYKEGPHAAQFILWEEGATLSRDNVEVPVGQKFPPGTVLKDGSAYAGGAGPGLAIAIYGVDTTAVGATPVSIACITRSAEVNRHAMAWPDGFDDAAIDAAATELAKQMIVVRGAPLPSPSESLNTLGANSPSPPPSPPQDGPEPLLP